MKKISQKAWAILDARWTPILFYGTSRTRVDAICELLWDYYGEEKVESQFPCGRSLRPKQKAEWDKLHRQGYRAVRVVTTVV